MSLVCGQCSRVNPAEAAYCYHDGTALAGRAGGPINAGTAPFPNQFVFPDGLACRNFDQLALACQQNWASAIDLLKQGFLGSFFGGMGRVDLAMAAKEAAQYPDADRGLDQLLAKLPTQALQGPKLQAEPSEISIGQLKIGEDRASELHLTNLGMRLLYGTVTSDCDWLTLGDAPGSPQKLFQFGADTTIPVHVRGQHLRAGAKPIEGHLVVDSNGGMVSVTVRADVPISPYPDGPFAGAVTPRQVAEKAKANAKEVALFFEKGDIAAWYKRNGWTYPVNGPIMPNVGAIQQFFEALGVARAPKVDFKPKSLDLNGAVGKTIDATIEVTTPDKKVVYGWATCDKSWVEIGKTKLGRATATIPITIRVPSPAPPLLETSINVVGNGNQRQTITLKVTVAGGKSGVVLQEEEVHALEIIEDDAPIVMEIPEKPIPTRPKTPVPTPTPLPTSAPAAIMEWTAPANTAITGGALAQEDSPFAIDDGPSSTSGPTVNLPKPPPGMPMPVQLLMHVAPVGILFVCILGLLVHDVFFAKRAVGGGDEDLPDKDRPFVMLQFDEGRKGDDKDYRDRMTFAVHKLDPDNKGTAPVKLNWYVNGLGNSTVARIDDQDRMFGFAPDDGKWALGSEKGRDAGKYGGKTRTFEFSSGVFITQTVTIEPGDPVQMANGEYKRLLNMCLVRYKIHNRDPKRSHKVGLRVLLDTCIGDNDGAPFTFPGVNEAVVTKRDFRGADVPDFVQILEKPSLRDPGTIVQLNLRFADKEKFDQPDRFLMTHYPGNDDKIIRKWEVPLVDMKLPGEPMGDSSVVIYWDPKELGPNKSREVMFTYGIGNISASSNKIALTVGGSMHVGGEMSVLAMIADKDAEWATIDLPLGLKLVDEKTRKQKIEKMRPDASNQLRPTPVTWRVIATSSGKYNIAVTTDTGSSASRRVTITAKSLFN